MTPLTFQLLRRASLYFAVAAVLLVVVPKVLRELGAIGPSLEEEIEHAVNALQAAEAFGAVAEEAAFQEATRDVARARELSSGGKGREARAAARHAQARAVDAQRVALAQREQMRREAQRLVLEVDRTLNGLEDVYKALSAQLPRAEVPRLFTLMKDARQAGATLFLAYEEEKFAKVLAEAPAVEKVLGSVREQLRAAGQGRPAGDRPSPR